VREHDRHRIQRQCGDCSGCKLLEVDHPDLQKPANEWCRHCRPGCGGCTIYDHRPSICRGFACQWLVTPTMSDVWRPNHAKMVVHLTRDKFDGGLSLIVTVDLSVPDRWRASPYYDDIKRTSGHGLKAAGVEYFHTYVNVENRRWLILPHEDVEVTGKAHVVMKVSEEDWRCVKFSSVAEGKAFIDAMEEAKDKFRKLTPTQQKMVAAHLEAVAANKAEG
jgi:hypothetical protein